MTAGLVLSFFVAFSLPFLVSGLWLLVRQRFGKPLPTVRAFATDNLISSVITIAITLVICLVFSWTGLLESFYYRPSQRDFGQAKELGIEPEEVTFETEDGIKLNGWFLAADGEPRGTVVHFHGSDRNLTSTIRNSAWVMERGFNLFAFDYRGYGKSTGQPSAAGLAIDSLTAIRYVQSRPDVDPGKVLLWGQSMGGQLAVSAAAASKAEPPAAVVAEATYASHRHHVKDKFSQMGPLWLLQWGPWITTSDKHAALPRVDQLSSTSLLLIHGTDDRVVQPYHSQWLFDSATGNKDLWMVQDAKHLTVFQDPVYRDRLCDYFESCLGSSVPMTTGDGE